MYTQTDIVIFSLIIMCICVYEQEQEKRKKVKAMRKKHAIL